MPESDSDKDLDAVVGYDRDTGEPVTMRKMLERSKRAPTPSALDFPVDEPTESGPAAKLTPQEKTALRLPARPGERVVVGQPEEQKTQRVEPWRERLGGDRLPAAPGQEQKTTPLEPDNEPVIEGELIPNTRPPRKVTKEEAAHRWATEAMHRQLSFNEYDKIRRSGLWDLFTERLRELRDFKGETED